jgi:hypothetical protein
MQIGHVAAVNWIVAVLEADIRKRIGVNLFRRALPKIADFGVGIIGRGLFIRTPTIGPKSSVQILLS